MVGIIVDVYALVGKASFLEKFQSAIVRSAKIRSAHKVPYRGQHKKTGNVISIRTEYLIDEEPLPLSRERHLGRVLAHQRVEKGVVLFGL